MVGRPRCSVELAHELHAANQSVSCRDELSSQGARGAVIFVREGVTVGLVSYQSRVILYRT